jgi:hypothetical protein
MFQTEVGGDKKTVNTDVSPAKGEWRHVAATVERLGSSTNVTVYVDGNEENETRFSATPTETNSEDLFICRN